MSPLWPAPCRAWWVAMPCAPVGRRRRCMWTCTCRSTYTCASGPRVRTAWQPTTPGTTVEEGHAITHQAEKALRLQYGQITDVVVHLEPPERVAAPRRGEVDYPEQRSSREAP